MFSLALTKRYIPAIILLAIFIIFSHVLVSRVISSNNELATIINISGKQRMLSQRLIVLGQGYYANPKFKHRFKAVLSEIKTAHKYLLTKNITKELDNIYFKQDLDKNLKAYIKHFDNLLVLHNPMFLKMAREDSADILIQLGQVVKEYEKYSNEKLEITAQYEFYMLLATLFILLIEVFFIFRPAAKKIDENTRELIQIKEYEKTIIESNNNAIIAIDWSFKITTYNRKAEEIFGWTKEEMIGSKNLLKIIPPKYRDKHIQASKDFMKTGKSSSLINKSHELEAIRKDGTIFPIIISIGARWKENSVIVVANISDITDKKQFEKQLMQSEKMVSMGEMIGNIAHQWRQPLSVISTSASGVHAKYEYGILKDEDIPLYMNTIVENAEYLSKTIDIFRNFIKGEKVCKSILLQDEIHQALSIVSSTLKDKQISLKDNVDYSNDINITMTTGELPQVIINILNNAKDILIERNIKNPSIELNIIIENDKVIITIEDNAGGIPDSIVGNIFDPYFTTKHQSQGTGLGLHMSYQIITDSLKGKLYTKNTNQGAKFFIELPLS